MSNWHQRFLDLAEHVASWSKDPSTKVGAVIARPDNTIVSLGYNGFPRGIADDHRLQNRETKYEMVVHAEENALLMAREPLRSCSIYTWPLPPCSRCAAKIIQSGISLVVSPPTPARWRENTAFACQILHEAGVSVRERNEEGQFPLLRKMSAVHGYPGVGLSPEAAFKQEPQDAAKMQGYEGQPCPECQNFTLVRNGTCLKCNTCGTTTGCS